MVDFCRDDVYFLGFLGNGEYYEDDDECSLKKINIHHFLSFCNFFYPETVKFLTDMDGKPKLQTEIFVGDR